jgi:hypothetical protein
MILRNKRWSRRLNRFIPGLRKYNKQTNLIFRTEMDQLFNDELGPDRYSSFALRGNWASPCFKGPVPTHDHKHIVYNNFYEEVSKYKFNFCPENSKFNGYLTEKPLQAMIAGCIPIYLGAPDVEKYLPKGSFIDMRYLNGDDLLGVINYMGEREYDRYRRKIRAFITSGKTKPFSSVSFAEKLIKILEENS